MPVKFSRPREHDDLGNIHFADLYNYKTETTIFYREYVNNPFAEIVKLENGSLGAILFLDICYRRFRIEGDAKLAELIRPLPPAIKPFEEKKDWTAIRNILLPVVVGHIIASGGLDEFIKLVYEMGDASGRSGLQSEFQSLLGLND